MRAIRVISIGICVSAAAVLSALAADNTPLKVKPGLWEVTSEGQNSGTPPIPPEALARLSPDQRAQMEAHFKDMMAKQAQRRVTKRCVTQKEIDQGFDKIDQMTRGQCTQTITASSSTLREGSIQCAGTTTSSGTYRFEAPNPETFSGNWDMTTSDSGHSMRLKNTMQGKWLSADCGTVQPGGN
jgi:Protein of unknown function (DUF3617)